MSFANFCGRQPKPLIALATVLCVLVIGWFDYITGYDVSLSVFYAAPVTFAVWFLGRPAGVVAALLSVTAWFIADRASGHPYHNAWIPTWNAAVRFTFLLLTVAGAWSIRAQLASTQAHADELEKALPLCTCCKKIQDDHGSWVALETYVMEHLSAVPTAKVCPDCAKQNYLAKIAPQGKPGASV